MTSGLIRFLRGQDQFGQSVQFTYKRQEGYGTVLGGACSFLLTLFFTFFIGVQIYGWLFHPEYDEHMNRGFLSRGTSETYVMSTTDFLPAIAVFSLNLETGEFSHSDPAYWNFNWQQSFLVDNDYTETPVDSIECLTLIDSFTELSEANRQAMKNELDDGIQCPNTSYISV